MHHHIHCLGQGSEAGFHDISVGKAIYEFPSLKAEDMFQVQAEGTKMILISTINHLQGRSCFYKNFAITEFQI